MNPEPMTVEAFRAAFPDDCDECGCVIMGAGNLRGDKLICDECREEESQ